MQELVQGEMARPVWTLADGVELTRGCPGAGEGALRSKEPWIQTLALPFRAAKPWASFLTPLQACLLPRKRDPPLSSLGNTVKIRIQTPSTSGMPDKEKIYSESYLDTGIPEHKTEAKPLSGPNRAGSQEAAWGSVRKHHIRGMEVSAG